MLSLPRKMESINKKLGVLKNSGFFCKVFTLWGQNIVRIPGDSLS